MHSMKLAAGFAVLCTASTQGFAMAGEFTSVPNLAFIKLPGFQQDKPQDSPFDFRDITLPPAFLFQGETPIPMEWWQQGSNSPIAIIIGNAEGTRSLNGSMNPAYYWHRDPGNGANNFGSFSFQHLSHQETAAVLDQASNDARRVEAANQALPEIADQRQLIKLRRFHDLLQAQAKRNGLQLSHLELINGLDLTTQSELAGLDAWGYVDRLTQMKKTVTDPDEQIIRARTWSYWDPVKNRWAAPGLGNTEYSIRRDQNRRFHAVKQALLYQEQQPSLLQEIDLAWASQTAANTNVSNSLDTSGTANEDVSKAEDAWAIALLNQPNSLEGSSFNSQPLQLEVAQNGLESLLTETVATEASLADAIAENATIAMATPDDIHLKDVDFKGELNRVKNQASPPSLSNSDAIEVALNLERPLALEPEAVPAWERLAMTPEEFALATAVASPSLIEDSASNIASDTASNVLDLADATRALEADAIATALEASVIEASVQTAATLAETPIAIEQQSEKTTAPISPDIASAPQTTHSSRNQRGSTETLVADALATSSAEAETLLLDAPSEEELDVTGSINSSLLMVQPFLPEELQAIPLDTGTETSPAGEAVKLGQPFKRTPEIVQVAAMAHVQAAEPLINNRIESKEFLDLASGLKDSPIEVSDEVVLDEVVLDEVTFNSAILDAQRLDESLGLAIASDSPKLMTSHEPETRTSLSEAIAPSTSLQFALEIEPLEPTDPWVTPEAAIEISAPPLEPIIPEDVQAMLEQQPRVETLEQPLSETVLFFEENISQ